MAIVEIKYHDDSALISDGQLEHLTNKAIDRLGAPVGAPITADVWGSIPSLARPDQGADLAECHSQPFKWLGLLLEITASSGVPMCGGSGTAHHKAGD